MYSCIYIYTYVHIHIHMYIYMCVCVCVWFLPRATAVAPEPSSVFRFRGGLVFKAPRLCVSLNSRLESNKEEEESRQVCDSLLGFTRLTRVVGGVGR